MMINNIKIKLVVGYTLAIILIMIASSIVGYVALEKIIVNANKKSLLTYLDTEYQESISKLKEWQANHDIESHYISVTAHKMAFNNIVYWIAPDNRILMAEELDNSISKSIGEFVKNWKTPFLKIETIHFEAPDSNITWHFLMVSKDVYDKDIFLGKVIVGTNLSPIDGISDKYVVVAIVIIALVSILAFFIGNFFASKAVEPIKIAIQRQNEFIDDASHEIRTPLGVLLSSIDVIKVSREDEETLDIMKTEILNMRDLVINLLALGRVEDAEKKTGFSVFSLLKLVESAIKSMRIMADDKKISLNLTADSNFEIFANESNIRNLLTILLDNAIKYSSRNTHIDIDVRKTANCAIISVKDQGFGIKESDVDKIFNRFYRVDKSRSREQGSFGLGLSLAKKIVELHKGKIEAESQYNIGSNFVVTLPL